MHDYPHDILAKPLPPSREIPRSFVISAAIDVVLVIIFAAIGRSSHAEGLSLGGIASTAWPFLLGLAAGWAALQAWKRSRHVWPTGVGVWLTTWGVAMALRALSGQGTALTFMAVALGFLGLGLVGWRFIAKFTSGARSNFPGLYQN